MSDGNTDHIRIQLKENGAARGYLTRLEEIATREIFATTLDHTGENERFLKTLDRLLRSGWDDKKEATRDINSLVEKLISRAVALAAENKREDEIMDSRVFLDRVIDEVTERNVPELNRAIGEVIKAARSADIEIYRPDTNIRAREAISALAANERGSR